MSSAPGPIASNPSPPDVVFLSRVGRSDLSDRFLRLEPPREATVGVFRDRVRSRTVAIVSYHLVPGVQAGSDYRPDRPRLVRRHRSEVRRLERLVAELQGQGTWCTPSATPTSKASALQG